MSVDVLLKPLTIGNLKLANRVVMAPMTRSKSPRHIPGKDVADYYGRRAEGGVGLIITEGTVIDHKASHGYPDVPNFFGKEALAGWEQVVKQVHAAWVKKITGKPTITVGSVGLDNDFVSTFMGDKAKVSENTVDILLKKLAAQEFDLVAVGRMLLSNPDWLHKIEKGTLDEIVPFSKEYTDRLY